MARTREQGEDPLLATRESACDLALAVEEDRERLVRALQSAGDALSGNPLAERKKQVLLDAQAREDPPALRHVDHAEAGDAKRRQPRDVLGRRT